MPNIYEKYWRSEYDILRRKKNKEINKLKKEKLEFMDKVYSILINEGYTDNEIFNLFKIKQQKGKI